MGQANHDMQVNTDSSEFDSSGLPIPHFFRFLECSSIMDDLTQLNTDKKCTFPVATENFYSQGYSGLCSSFGIVSALRCAIRKYAEDNDIPELFALNYNDRSQHTNMIRLMGSHVHVTTMDGLAKNMRLNCRSMGCQEVDPAEIIQKLLQKKLFQRSNGWKIVCHEFLRDCPDVMKNMRLVYKKIIPDNENMLDDDIDNGSMYFSEALKNKYGCVVVLGQIFEGIDFPETPFQTVEEHAEYASRRYESRLPKNYHSVFLVDENEDCWVFKDWYGPRLTYVHKKYSTVTNFINSEQHANTPSQIDDNHLDFNDNSDYFFVRGYALYFENIR